MKVAVITGAASGIGLALSKLCLAKNWMVIMVDKDACGLHEAIESLTTEYAPQIKSYVCDITQDQEVLKLAQYCQQHAPCINWLFNNAGIIGPIAPLWEIPHQSIQQVMDVNLHGMIRIIQAFTPLLFSQSHTSRIINIASLYGICSGSLVAPYTMSKHAVLALSESLHYDLKRLNKPVEVSVAFPSFTATALLASDKKNHSALQEALSNLLTHSRPVMEVAEQIIRQIEQNQFYIFPDKEVKGYCEERTKAMVEQTEPHTNNIEKLMRSLIRRSEKKQ